MRYNVRLDSNELYTLADALEKYADDFETKVQTFLNKLADLGISVAKANGGVFGQYIVYSKKFEASGEKQTVKMLATSENITNTWYVSSKSQDVREEEISPILMAEFGSGHYAISGEGETSGLGGQGTLNKYGHAFDANGWYWWTEDSSRDGEIRKVKDGRFLYHSDGLPPSQPLHKAVMACIEQVEGIAQEVFG